MKKWLLIFLISASVHADLSSHLNKLGEGEMRYLFWTLYKAELYGIKSDSILNFNHDIVFTLTYQRSISSAALIAATKDQWQHLDYTNEAIDKWITLLIDLLPTVKKQDALTLKLDKQNYSYFYLNNKAIGNIQDPTFGPAFLSIWLSKNTSEPKLRKQLLGNP
jgi:hypothetical protein